MLLSQIPDPVKVPYSCPVCHVEFPSFATWTRKDADHYTASRNYSTVIVDDNSGVTDRDDVDVPAHFSGGMKNTRVSSVEFATVKQVAFAASLGVTIPDGCSKREASRMIDAAKTSAPATAPVARTNRFDGPCVSCRQNVPAETGTLSKVDEKWVVRHLGTCTVVETPAPVARPSVDVPDGYYAIASTGSNDLAFYRVKHSDKWGISLSLVVGGHSDMFVARKNIAGIVERIAADAGAAKRYADEIGSCYRCNKTLTDDESRRLGIGPTCRSRA